MGIQVQPCCCGGVEEWYVLTTDGWLIQYDLLNGEFGTAVLVADIATGNANGYTAGYALRWVPGVGLHTIMWRNSSGFVDDIPDLVQINLDGTTNITTGIQSPALRHSNSWGIAVYEDGTIYGVEQTRSTPIFPNNPYFLFTFDRLTGNVSAKSTSLRTISSVSIGPIHSIDFGGGILYGFESDITGRYIFTINPVVGDATILVDLTSDPTAPGQGAMAHHEGLLHIVWGFGPFSRGYWDIVGGTWNRLPDAPILGYVSGRIQGLAKTGA